MNRRWASAVVVVLATGCGPRAPGLADGRADVGVDAADEGAPGRDGARADGGAADAARDGATAGCPIVGGLCARAPLYTSKIGIWYTLWWMPGNTGHWADWARYAPQAGYYQSGQGAAFASHLQQFAAMHVDFLLLDHTNGLGADGGNLQANGTAIVATLATTPGVQQAVAMGAALWTSATPNLALQATEADQVYTGYADATHASRFVVDGAPLMVVYTSPGHGDDWTDARFTLGAATGTVSGATATMLARGMYGWVFDEPTPVSPRVMGVMPGWSTAHLGRATTPIAREGGALFQREWLRAIQANPEVIVINSWNDFAEETAIEPATRTAAGAELWADSYGTETPAFYAEIARAYALLRWGLEAGTYVREESADPVYLVSAAGLTYVAAMPHQHPVIFVPDGYLAQFTHL